MAGFSWKRKEGEDAAGTRVFTEFVRALERGGEPDPAGEYEMRIAEK